MSSPLAQPHHPGRRAWPWLLAAGAVLGIIAVVAWWVSWPGWLWNSDLPSVHPRTFDGSSADLKQTIVVPTLDTPIPEGKSAIWCSSFQVAWNHLKELAGGPVQMQTAEEVARRLNQAEQSEKDLTPGTFYATAGWTRDGVANRIRKEMATRFPEASVPDLSDPSIVAVAYAYLKAGVPFEYPYFENDKPLVFEDGRGITTAIRSFGFPKANPGPPRHLQQQPGILLWSFEKPDEFALDLCRNSAPNQVVVARTERKPTLAETFSALQLRIAESPPPPEFARGFISGDTFLVPNLHWRIEHRFTELEGDYRPLLNPSLQGFHLDRAMQVIEFKLDRSGAELASEAITSVKKFGPRAFHFNRPFLIYMKKRDAQHPFFVMWVDNAELLQRR